MTASDRRASISTCAYVWRLALSPPSLMTMSALLRASELEVPQAFGHTVVQRRAACSADGGQRDCQLIRIMCEGLAGERQ